MMSGDATPVTPACRGQGCTADQWTMSGLVAVATFQRTPPGPDGSLVTSLKIMCHSPPAHTMASSFTPARGELSMGLRSDDHRTVGGGEPSAMQA